MKKLLSTLLLSVSTAAFAQQTVTQGACPNPKKLKNICMYVDGKQEDSESLKGYSFVYQKRLLEAACVDVEKDSEEVVADKVRKMWKQFEPQLVCNSLKFDVMNGSIVKYASIVMFDAFIHDIARWKVDLNKVDAADGMTALDYLRDNLEKTKGTDTHRKLTNYYDILRRAGAKHRSEL
jgi:hypothetical protein